MAAPGATASINPPVIRVRNRPPYRRPPTFLEIFLPDKNLRDELTELTEAVRELRDREVASELASLRAEVEKLRADRASHHCHGCHCMHINWYPYTPVTTTPVWVSQPYTVTCGGASQTSAGNTTTYSITN